jgi:hypothetical protein
MFDAVASHFGETHPETTFVDYEVFGNIHGSGETTIVPAIPAKLKEYNVTAVVAGVGG